MPILQRAWFADHSPGNGFFVAVVPPATTLMTDCNASSQIVGPVPTGVVGSSKFTFSFWVDVATLISLDDLSFSFAAGNATKDFTIQYEPVGVPGMNITFHTAVGVGGNATNLAPGYAGFPSTGYLNIICSADLSIPAFSLAVCASDLGISADYSNTAGSIFSAYPGGTTIPFDLVPSTAEWGLHFSNGLLVGPLVDWVTLIIGTYYDLTVAGNRRLFNTACSGATLVPADTTALSPVFLMHGAPASPSTIFNQADSSAWVNNPINAWISAPGIPPCP